MTCRIVGPECAAKMGLVQGASRATAAIPEVIAAQANATNEPNVEVTVA